MKLEIKHIAPYFPYCLNGLFHKRKDIVTEIELENKIISSLNNGSILIDGFTPILKPMSQVSTLFKDFVDVMPFGNEYKSHLFFEEKKHTDKTDLFWIKSNVETELMINKSQPLTSPYLAVEVMIKNHYDVFGLIEAGLAIDINTI